MLGNRKRKKTTALDRVEASAKMLEERVARARELVGGPVGQGLDDVLERATETWKSVRIATDKAGRVAGERLAQAGELVSEGGERLGKGMQQAAQEYQEHPQRTHGAGMGGFVGAVIGAFGGPVGAAIGAAAGAAAGSWLGAQVDQD